MASLTVNGYVLRTQNDWFALERQFYTNIDPLWNLDPSTPDGLKMAHDAEVFYALDETLQQAYNSKDPSKAKGLDLDIICALTGTVRSQGTGSTVALSFTGTPGTFIPEGNRFESSTTGSRWTTDQSVVLDVTGVATIQATATVTGPTQADAGSITKIVDVVGGLATVTNAAPATPGTDRQTNAQLRVERATSVGRPGSNQIDSLLGELFAVEGVRRVKVYENDGNVTDSNGLPAHSVAAVVDGGDADDIALAIYLKKNPGVLLHPAATPVVVEVTSPTYPTQKKDITFSIPVYVDPVIALEVTDDGTLPSDVDQELIDAIVEFGNGQLIPADVGFKITGFDIGESVPYSTVYTPINKVLGKYGNSYVSSLTLNGGTSNLAIAFNELSRWTPTNITVTVV